MSLARTTGDSFFGRVGMRFPEFYRQITENNADIFGLPVRFFASRLMYRRDLLLTAGLAPNRPPQTWDEVMEFALRIRAATGGEAAGLHLADSVADWYLLGLGGLLARQEESSDGRERWVSLVDSPEMARTVEFLRRLILTKWVIRADGQATVVLKPADADLPPEIKWSGNSLASGSRVEVGGWAGCCLRQRCC